MRRGFPVTWRRNRWRLSLPLSGVIPDSGGETTPWFFCSRVSVSALRRASPHSLDDIDWRAGEVIVRGKGQRHDRVPIPPDVGEALTDYIRNDRLSTSRAL